MFKYNDQSTRTTSGVFIVNFEYISHVFFSISIIDFEQEYISWVNGLESAHKES